MSPSILDIDPGLCFIAGRWCAAVSSVHLPVLEPSDGSTLCEIARGRADDVDLTVEAAMDGPWGAGCRGSNAGAFCTSRRAAFWADIRNHMDSARHRRLPEHDNAAALPSAIHGRGTDLITAMAATGTLYYFINQGDPDAGDLVGVVTFIHTSLANLVWAYLIGHAGFAVLQHFFNSYNLRHMWSLGSGTHTGH